MPHFFTALSANSSGRTKIKIPPFVLNTGLFLLGVQTKRDNTKRHVSRRLSRTADEKGVGGRTNSYFLPSEQQQQVQLSRCTDPQSLVWIAEIPTLDRKESAAIQTSVVEVFFFL
ncbi:hypothetical protein TNCV_2003411 [Trichonephila clavipes]|nr:hypothetical protein TNCV_2003411 [Trichonephila clavipes]